MKIEQTINSFLSRYPKLKFIVKRCYQGMMYLTSKKVKYEGNIKKVSPNDDYEYFFGYYDKSPWNIDEKYMICLRAKCTYKDVSPKEEAEIILIDIDSNCKIEVIGKTKTWNVQQGCMLQWLGPDYNEKIIYNDFRNNKYCSIIYNIRTHEEKIVEEPVYTVAKNGKVALTLNFSRLYDLRPGYGYYNIKDTAKGIACPDEYCIKKINLETGKVEGVLKYTDFATFNENKNMKNAIHKVNHIMINPDCTRFMVLHRWFNGDKKTTRLVTVDMDGRDMYNLLYDGMVSNCCWKNNNEILAWAHKEKIGNQYYLLKDKTKEYKVMWKNELTSDGHPTYSPNGKYIITDSYADRKRMCHIFLMNTENTEVREIAKVFEPFKYDNDTRCDLHPRWDRKSKRICFDGVFEGKRALYTLKIEE